MTLTVSTLLLGCVRICYTEIEKRAYGHTCPLGVRGRDPHQLAVSSRPPDHDPYLSSFAVLSTSQARPLPRADLWWPMCPHRLAPHGNRSPAKPVRCSRGRRAATPFSLPLGACGSESTEEPMAAMPPTQIGPRVVPRALARCGIQRRRTMVVPLAFPVRRPRHVPASSDRGAHHRSHHDHRHCRHHNHHGPAAACFRPR